MKRIRDFFIDNSFYILIILFGLLLYLLNNNKKYYYIVFIVGCLIVLFIFLTYIDSSRRYKRIRKSVDKEFGKNNVNKIIKYLNIDLKNEFGNRVRNNSEVIRIYEDICYDCEDVLNLENKVNYLINDYKKDIKRINNKTNSDFIKRSDEIIDIIFKYYDEDGNKMQP